jgi:hypothetical protein
MKALLLLAFLAGALAGQITCPANNNTGVPSALQITPGYKYSFVWPKSGSQGYFYIKIDTAATALNQVIYFRASGDADTADVSGVLNIKFSVDQKGAVGDSNWLMCSLAAGGGDCSKYLSMNNLPGNATINDGSYLWFSLFPTCSACSKTLEFSVETAWVSALSSSDNPPANLYLPIPFVDQFRSMVFKISTHDWIYSYVPGLNLNDQLTYSIVYDSSTDGSSQTVLYFQKGSKPNTTYYAVDGGVFPVDGVEKGSYLMTRPFTASAANGGAGDYWVGFYVLANTAGNVDLTFKGALNGIPCSGASSLFVATLLFALIPITVLLS